MKRDWDLLTEIFDHIDNETLDAFVENDTERNDLILRHLELLVDGDYLAGVDIRRTSVGLYYQSNEPRLTMSGHELADIIRDKKLFSRVKKAIAAAGYLITFETLKAFAPKVLKIIVDNIKLT